MQKLYLFLYEIYFEERRKKYFSFAAN